MKRYLAALAVAALPLAAEAAEVQFEGTYRARGRMFDSLSLTNDATLGEGLAAYGQHRLWLAPRFIVSDKVALFTEIRGFDGTYFGTPAASFFDASTEDARLGYSDDVLTSTTDAGVSPLNLQLWRAWGVVDTDIGRFSFGRMPLHWGLGMWQNDGLGIDADYGDSADRVMWEAEVSNLWLRAAIDVDAESFVNQSDDTTSFNAAVAFKKERLDIGSNFQVRHTSRAEDSGTFTVFTGDIAGDVTMGSLSARVEFAAQVGEGDLGDGRNDVSVLAFGAVGDATLDVQPWRFRLAGGLATGDGNPNDSQLRGFQFDRDYDVGLILFEQPLPTLAAATANDTNGGRDYADVLAGNAVSNAIFGKLTVGRTLIEGIDLEAYALTARVAAQPDDDLGRIGYGYELGLRGAWRPFEHFELLAGGAVLLPGTYFRNYDGDVDLTRAVIGGELLARIRF